MAVIAKKDKLYNFHEDFTEEELEAVKKIMAERIKNYVFMTAEEKAKGLIDGFEKFYFTEIDTISIVFEMNFVFADALEILGGLRRKEA